MSGPFKVGDVVVCVDDACGKPQYGSERIEARFYIQDRRSCVLSLSVAPGVQSASA
jgi:hypothetical protein